MQRPHTRHEKRSHAGSQDDPVYSDLMDMRTTHCPPALDMHPHHVPSERHFTAASAGSNTHHAPRCEYRGEEQYRPWGSAEEEIVSEVAVRKRQYCAQWLSSQGHMTTGEDGDGELGSGGSANRSSENEDLILQRREERRTKGKKISMGMCVGLPPRRVRFCVSIYIL